MEGNARNPVFNVCCPFALLSCVFCLILIAAGSYVYLYWLTPLFWIWHAKNLWIFTNPRLLSWNPVHVTKLHPCHTTWRLCTGHNVCDKKSRPLDLSILIPYLSSGCSDHTLFVLPQLSLFCIEILALYCVFILKYIFLKMAMFLLKSLCKGIHFSLVSWGFLHHKNSFKLFTIPLPKVALKYMFLWPS